MAENPAGAEYVRSHQPRAPSRPTNVIGLDRVMGGPRGRRNRGYWVTALRSRRSRRGWITPHKAACCIPIIHSIIEATLTIDQCIAAPECASCLTTKNVCTFQIRQGNNAKEQYEVLQISLKSTC